MADETFTARTGKIYDSAGNIVNIADLAQNIFTLLQTSAAQATQVTQATHNNLNCNANMQVNDTDVSTGNKIPVSDSNMLDYSFATAKSQKLNGAGTITPAAGTIFHEIHFHTSTIITAMTVTAGWADYTGETMPAGSFIVTDCSSIQLTSGFISAYQRLT